MEAEDIGHPPDPSHPPGILPSATGSLAPNPPEPKPPVGEDMPPEAPDGPAPPPRRITVRHPTLRDRVIEHLRGHQADSISGIARALAASGEAPVHRLTIAGYLQALAESGVLRELDRPPSKLYQLQNPESHWSLHQRVHRVLKESHLLETDRFRLALALLQRVLGRPVFLAEMQHAGFQGLPSGIDKLVVGDAVRRQYRDLLLRRASPRIEVPSRDPLLALAPEDPLHNSPLLEETLRRLLLRATGSEHLMAERPAGPQQAQLQVGERP